MVEDHPTDDSDSVPQPETAASAPDAQPDDMGALLLKVIELLDLLADAKAPRLFVTDAELIRRIGVPFALDRDPRTSGFPQKQKLWGNRRYWPAVAAYFEHVYGYKLGDLKIERRPR
ncbi:MAG TPA: hypothetical protein VK749_15890 [Xanthobacteraceae bacterium]|jgi:hypothetical protein|nr:hypothetical protein [Xanthobacteraceae bacterium]